MFPIIYTNAVWFQFLCSINAAFGVSNKFVPYRPSWDLVAASIKAVLIDTSDFFTANTDYTVLSNSKIYKQGNHVFGFLVVQKTNGNFGTTDSIIGSVKSSYRPVYSNLGQSFYGQDQFNVRDLGYCFIYYLNGNVTVNTSGLATSSYTYVNIPINYIIN